jgi:hypothetical protein
MLVESMLPDAMALTIPSAGRASNERATNPPSSVPPVVGHPQEQAHVRRPPFCRDLDRQVRRPDTPLLAPAVSAPLDLQFVRDRRVFRLVRHRQPVARRRVVVLPPRVGRSAAKGLYILASHSCHYVFVHVPRTGTSIVVISRTTADRSFLQQTVIIHRKTVDDDLVFPPERSAI